MRMSLGSVVRLAIAAMLATPAVESAGALCTQAPANRARTAHIDSAVSFTGAGSTRMSDGTFLVVWTGVDCVGWFRILGNVSVDAAWRHIVVPRDGRFVAHEESPRGRRDYTLESSGDATLSVDGRTVPVDSSAAEWVDAVVREFVRRLGFGAARRANEILQQQGLRALIDEAARIPHDEIRAQYLIAGFRAVKDSGRVQFLHDGSELLDDPFARTSFLLATPAAWRGSVDVLKAVYDEAARVEPDDLVEQILHTTPPPAPTPLALEPSLGRLIATLQNSERRTSLRTLYLSVRR
jgi:hypothetical protein